MICSPLGRGKLRTVALLSVLYLCFLLPPFVSAAIDNPIGAWHFDESSGDLLNHSGSLDGTVSGSVTQNAGTGIVDEYYDFTGGHVNMSNPAALNVNRADHTTLILLNYDVQGGGRSALSFHYGTSTGVGWDVMYHTSNYIRLNVPNDDLTLSAFAPTAGQWYCLGVSYEDSTKNLTFWNNGSSVGSKTLGQNFGSTTDAQPVLFGDANYFYSDFNGKIDEALHYNETLNETEITEICEYWSDGIPFPFSGTPAGPIPEVQVRIHDYYNTSLYVHGLNITIFNSTYSISNLTDNNGYATFYNYSGEYDYNITDPAGRYWSDDPSDNVSNGTLEEEAVTGTLYNFNASNIYNEKLYNFTVCPDITAWCDDSGVTGLATISVTPNRTANFEIMVWDGNYSLNTSNATYINQTFSFTAGLQESTTRNFTGLYQSLLTVNVSVGGTATQVSNFTINLTNISGTSYTEIKNTSNYTIQFPLMFGNYSLTAIPTGYSYAYVNLTIAPFNQTPYTIIPVYALNSFYLTLLDEITRDLITETMTVELISDAAAYNYTTSNGSISLEILTPAEYSIRYRGTNYYERDYYQTLVNNNYYTINLYDLNTTEADVLVVTVEDTGGDAVEDATVKLLRYFVYCNCYEVVEMAKTSYTGEALFYIDSYDGHYKFIVEYGEETVFSSTLPQNFQPTDGLVLKTITVNLGQDYYETFRELPKVYRHITWNNNTGALTFSWNDPTGTVSQGCLYAENISGLQYESAGYSCANGSTGSVFVLLPNYRTSQTKYYAQVESAGDYSVFTILTGFIDKLPIYDFGQAGFFLGAGVTLGLALLFSFSAIAVIIITALGLIVMSILGLAPLSLTFIVGFATLGIGMAVYMMRS